METRQADIGETDIFKELTDRESRRDNLVLYQVEEAPYGIKRGTDRKEYDKDTLGDILKTINIVLDWDKDIKFLTRTGEFNMNQKKPRPMLVGIPQ